eukprot:7773781-Pyramimonas_sp.AAC.2
MRPQNFYEDRSKTSATTRTARATRSTWKVASRSAPTRTKIGGTLSTTTWQATTPRSHGETGLPEASEDHELLQRYRQGYT